MPGRKPTPHGGIVRKPQIHTGILGSPGNPKSLRGSGAVPLFLANNPAHIANLREWPDVGPNHTIFTSDQRAADYRPLANRIARHMEASGRFPGLYAIADQAMLTLRNCRDVVIENLHFQDCWPTAIYLDHCQRITIRCCSFFGGTYAIVARGGSTRDIVVENCFWQQDDENVPEGIWQRQGGASGLPIWNGIEWQKIHGDRRDFKYPVNVEEDWRLYDGDFFRAFGIAGNIVVRRNLIRNAFNAVHSFGSESGMLDVPCRNVLIGENLFFRIRDNTVEPETGAANWVVRNNRFIDNFRPFSIEGEKTGYLYIYANEGWNVTKPGAGDSDMNTGASLFKFTSQSQTDGPVTFAHNSFFLARDIAKKFGVAQLTVANNAMTSVANEAIFGKKWNAPIHDFDENERFTRRWDELAIRFFGNAMHTPQIADAGISPHYPAALRAAGYPVPRQENGCDPQFVLIPGKDKPEIGDLRLQETSPLRSKSRELELRLPDGDKISVAGGRDIGAWQGNSLFLLDREFPFLDGIFGCGAAGGA